MVPMHLPPMAPRNLAEQIRALLSRLPHGMGAGHIACHRITTWSCGRRAQVDGEGGMMAGLSRQLVGSFGYDADQLRLTFCDDEGPHRPPPRSAAPRRDRSNPLQPPPASGRVRFQPRAAATQAKPASSRTTTICWRQCSTATGAGPFSKWRRCASWHLPARVSATPYYYGPSIQPSIQLSI
jgi:hypothetical protein